MVAVIPMEIRAVSGGICNVTVRGASSVVVLKAECVSLCTKESDSAIQSKLINCFSLSV